ncbi:hypothetical protein pb186bvf_020774 [Paramecium bursaria]
MSKEELKKQLEDYGFEEKYINQAVLQSNNLEEAVNLIVLLQEQDSQPIFQQQQVNPKPPQQAQGNAQQGLFTNINDIQFDIDFSDIKPIQQDKRFKMVCVVRNDLKMGIGKIAAQTGHAVLGAYKQMQNRNLVHDLFQWEECGQAKIVVKCESQQELLDLQSRAQQLGLNNYIVQDAGRTQVEPGSLTVMALGPADGNLIDQVTKHLKLL